MVMCCEGVLDAAAVRDLRALVGGVEPVPGRATAGWAAVDGKHNLQYPAGHAAIEDAAARVLQALALHIPFQLAARPLRISTPLFNRYARGMRYDEHVDDAVMGGLRTDLSWTLFLSDPEEYDGGELVISDVAGEQPHKLSAGALLLYQGGRTHRVEPVTRGERLAAVGWVQSLVRDAGARSILFDLDLARRQVFAEHGRNETFAALSRALGQLLRRWAEP